MTLTRTSQPQTDQSDICETRNGVRLRSRFVRASAVLVLAGSLTAGLAGVTAAQARPAASGRATVVKVVTRHPFGKMLATIKGRSLYYLPSGTCTGNCLSIWPPLLMPRGKTIPLGTRCLKTARFGHRLQVTYRGKRLYRFVSDSGSSVNGNGVGGFKVAKLRTGACSSTWRY
jgi:predicted lipoprotein with Yx(FWY)xxD motif